MPHLRVAHLRQQGQDMIIVPLDSEFGRRTSQERDGVISEIRLRSAAAGLAGEVVTVWDAGAGRMGFIAPPPWHPFFRSIGLGFVHANLNRELVW